MALHQVYCAKLKKDAPGLDTDDLQDQLALDMVESVGGQALRQRVYETISQEAWALWKARLTMLMNEYRLNMMDPQTDDFIRQHMEAFLFGEDAPPPPGYVPPAGSA